MVWRWALAPGGTRALCTPSRKGSAGLTPHAVIEDRGPACSGASNLTRKSVSPSTAPIANIRAACRSTTAKLPRRSSGVRWKVRFQANMPSRDEASMPVGARPFPTRYRPIGSPNPNPSSRIERPAARSSQDTSFHGVPTPPQRGPCPPMATKEHLDPTRMRAHPAFAFGRSGQTGEGQPRRVTDALPAPAFDVAQGHADHRARCSERPRPSLRVSSAAERSTPR